MTTQRVERMRRRYNENRAFMPPQAQEFSTAEVREYCEPEEGWDDDNQPESGWYGRLSAPGYLDCTEWDGPYQRGWMALRAVCETHEVGLDGHDLVDPS